MADTPRLFRTQQSSRSGSISEEEDESSSLVTSLHTTTTREGWWAAAPLFRLHCCWLTARLARSAELVHVEFQPRPDDVLLATFPKSGTTWLKALAFALTNRCRHPITAAAIGSSGHPLLSSNPHDLVPFLEMPVRSHLRPVTELEALPSPRLLCTHLPPVLLPPGMLSSCGRAVYLCRDPKDVFVSYWHHAQTLRRHESGSGGLVDFDKAFELFCVGVSVYGSVLEHYLEYWKRSVREPDMLLFLKYEDMMAQPAKHVRMLAEFLGVPFIEEEESSGAVEEVVRLCSFQNLKNLQVNTHGVANWIGAVAVPTKNSLFFRSASVGDWENHLTQEMAHKLDRVRPSSMQCFQFLTRTYFKNSA